MYKKLIILKMSTTTEGLLGQTVGETTQINSVNLSNSIGTIEVEQLPEEYKGLTPTVKVLPAKVEKRTLPPQYKTNKLPPKDEHKKLNPIFPPGVQPFAIPNF